MKYYYYYYFFIYPIKPLLAYGGNARMLCTGKTLWGRKPVSLGLSFVFCRYRVDVGDTKGYDPFHLNSIRSISHIVGDGWKNSRAFTSALRC